MYNPRTIHAVRQSSRSSGLLSLVLAFFVFPRVALDCRDANQERAGAGIKWDKRSACEGTPLQTPPEESCQQSLADEGGASMVDALS